MLYSFRRNKSKNTPGTGDEKKSIPRILLRYFLIGSGSLLLIAVSFSVWIYLSFFWGPGAFDTNEFHPFRSERTRAKYLEHYDASAKIWPLDSEERMVATSYGQTFVRISGPEGAPSLVLLPGGGASSLMWANNIEALSENYRTYALDHIYDWGRSIYTRRMGCPENLTKWLGELFTALELEDSINLIGYSYGGWLASQFLLAHPERLNKVIWSSPAYTVYNGNKEFEKKVLIGFIPLKYFMRRSLYWSCEDMVQTEEGRKIADKMVADHRLAIRCFKTKMPASMTVLSDEELQSITNPVLFIAGENEVIYPVEDAAARLRRIAPEIGIEIVPNAGHCMIFTNPEIMSEIYLDFLKH